jgi:hypothetical protein
MQRTEIGKLVGLRQNTHMPPFNAKSFAMGLCAAGALFAASCATTPQQSDNSATRPLEADYRHGGTETDYDHDPRGLTDQGRRNAAVRAMESFQ